MENDRHMTDAAPPTQTSGRTSHPPMAPKEALAGFQRDLATVRAEIGKVIVGNQEIVDGVLTCMLAGGNALDRGVDTILEALAAGPFIFNLGHGILPPTPIAHVEQMLRRVRG